MISKYNKFLNENTYKDEFLRLYNLAPESLKELVDDTKEVQQGADWHPEGVVYIHIRLVTNRLENTYHDKNLNLAGFFHDLGKIYVSKPNGRGGWSAHGHEDESVKIVKRFRSWIKEQGGAVDIVTYIVENHMRYKYLDDMRIQEQIKFMDDVYFHYVQKFSTADIGGTVLNCNPIDEHLTVREKIREFEKNEKENKIIKKKFNATMIMDKYPELRGEKLGNALNLFKRNYEDFRSFILNNTTKDILKAFDDYMMTVNEGIKDKMIPISKENINKSIEQINKHVKKEDLPVANMITGCENGLIDLVQDSIDNGVDIHFKNEIFLQMACYNGHIEIVKLLLDLGADPTIENDYPYNLAVAKGHRDIALLLLDYMNK